jgi:hypothetical protein
MLADMSHTERIRFLRNRTLAIWKRNAGNRFEQGAPPSGVDDSIRAARALGQKAYIRQQAGGSCGNGPSAVVIPPPCCNTNID